MSEQPCITNCKRRCVLHSGQRGEGSMRFIGSKYSDGDTRGHRSEETHVVREVDEVRTMFVACNYERA